MCSLGIKYLPILIKKIDPKNRKGICNDISKLIVEILEELKEYDIIFGNIYDLKVTNKNAQYMSIYIK